MYYNHNLRTNIQEWKSRLYKASSEQFGHQLKYCFSNIENNKLLKSLLQEAILKYKYEPETLVEIANQMENGHIQMTYLDVVQHASFCYQILNYIIELDNTYNVHNLTFFYHGNFEDIKKDIIEGYITPIFYYFHDKLEKTNSVVYLLEKYKRRTEWFTSTHLFREYAEADKNYEQIFEDDLRLFLFDQGIDYPFSTPKSKSGRADIVGSIDTSEPIIIEIKIFDRTKSYGKNRIIEGFSQIIKYTNDFNKDTGYLIVFNVDKAEINFQFNESTKIFPPMLVLNNKVYYFIIINLNNESSASKIGTTEVISISESDLTK